MLQLYIIRHGFAGKSLDDALADEKRPLKKKGKDQMKEVGKGLKALDISFDVVLTSPLLRAKESAEIVNAYCGNSKKIKVTDLLKPGSSLDKLIKFLKEFEEAKVAIVGHEPFLSTFASYCLAKTKRTFIDLKKGGVLVLEVEGQIKSGGCMLSWLMEPRHIISKV